MSHIKHQLQEEEEIKQGRDQKESPKDDSDDTLDDTLVEEQEMKTIISRKKVSKKLSLQQALMLRNVEKSVKVAVEAKKNVTPKEIFSLNDALTKFNVNDEQDKQLPDSHVGEIENIQQEEHETKQDSTAAVE